MAHSYLMQRLLRLTSIANNAEKENKNVTEAAEENFYSRRKFLSGSAKAALAATVLAGCNKAINNKGTEPPNNGQHNANETSVAVIGGGIAGLHAAHILKKGGVNNTVYDAGRRAGGRIFSAQDILNPGLSTELGGEFIDSDHYDMHNLAKEFGLPMFDLYSPAELKLQQNIYYFNNTSYSDDDFLDAIKYYLPAIKRDANSLSDIITYNSFSPTDAKFDNMNLEQYFDSIHLTGWLRDLLLVAYLGEYGLNTNECNAINFLYLFGPAPNHKYALYGSSDERFRVSGGNQKIVDALYNSVKDSVNLNHKLVKIEAAFNGYKLYFENKPKAVKADIVLFALPFNLLRDVEINVELPQAKRYAINNLSYGNNSKLVLGFNEKLWRDKYNCVGMCYAGNGIQNLWDNSQMQPGKNGGLTIFLGGDDAVALSNSTAGFQASKYLSKINEVYPGVAQTYNNKSYRMIWPSYQLAKGSYSAWSVGQYTTIAGSEGETVGNLFFAGEHTSYDYQGFMNGGAATGRIAANAILRKIK